ncbi:Ionotropic receptor 939 [Blattella germanica]|nr:Ionotropic receptor 939 [Blattella germanica]
MEPKFPNQLAKVLLLILMVSTGYQKRQQTSEVKCISEAALHWVPEGSTLVFLRQLYDKYKFSYTITEKSINSEVINITSDICPIMTEIEIINASAMSETRKDLVELILQPFSCKQDKGPIYKTLSTLHSSNRWPILIPEYEKQEFNYRDADHRVFFVVMERLIERNEFRGMLSLIRFMNLGSPNNLFIIVITQQYANTVFQVRNIFEILLTLYMHNIILIVRHDPNVLMAYTFSFVKPSPRQSPCTMKIQFLNIGRCHLHNGWTILAPPTTVHEVTYWTRCYFLTNVFTTNLMLMNQPDEDLNDRLAAIDEPLILTGLAPVMLMTSIKHLKPDEKVQFIDQRYSLVKRKKSIILGTSENIAQPFMLDALNNGQLWTYFYTMKYNWYVKRAEPYPRWTSIIRVFSPSTWVSFFTSVFVAAMIFRVLKQNRSFGGSLSDTWATVIGVAVTRMPRTVATRVFFMCWITYSLAINTIFQTFVVSYFFNPGLQYQINSYKEMLDLNYSFVNTMPYPFQYHLTGEKYQLGDPIACYEFLSAYPNSAAFLNEELLLLQLKFFCNKSTVSDIFKTQEQGQVHIYLISVNYPIMHYVKKIITRMREGGILDEMVKHQMQYSEIFYPTASFRGEEYQDMSLIHAQSVFVAYGMGNAFSILVFICELLMKKVKLI